MFFVTRFRTRLNQQPANIVETNIRYLYIEIFFAGILGTIATYNNLFAVRLGATTALIGILTSAPALVTAVTSIPSARLLESKTHRKAWLLGSLWIIRMGYLGVVLLPNIAPNNTAVWLVVWIIVLTLPNAFFTNGFNAMLAELIPERRRAFVFSRRTIILSLTTAVILALAGSYLDATTHWFPANYQIMYLFGVVTVLGSQLYLMRLVVPDSVVQVRVNATDPTPTSRVRMGRPMKNMLVNMFFYQIGLQIAGPLFVIYYVNNLGVSDGLISVSNAAGTMGVVVGLVLWEALLRKHSFSWAMKTAMLGTWFFPFTVAFAHDFRLIIVANFVVNLLHPGVDLSSLNVILKLSTPDQRNLNMSYYTAVTSISAFIAPLAAVPLSAQIGIPGVMVIAAAFRFGGGLLFRLNDVGEMPPELSSALPQP